MQNTLSENPMQTSIDVILGKHLTTSFKGKLRAEVDKELVKMESQFSTQEKMKIFVGTWNLDGVKPYD